MLGRSLGIAARVFATTDPLPLPVLVQIVLLKKHSGIVALPNANPCRQLNKPRNRWQGKNLFTQLITHLFAHLIKQLDTHLSKLPTGRVIQPA